MTTWTPEDLALLTGSESLVLTAGDDGHPGVEIGVTPPPRERGGFSLCRLGFATDQPGP
ncbi:hypothetical protein [Streptomyces sp. NPDC056227]|uniref:hypothetical protein n=1 Tax=Streptomyces sp. NPDC056227 TaxID=3345753 RepID=UPI0035D790CA